MSDHDDDNLSSDYKEKTKRKAKRGSRRGPVGVFLLALLAGLGALTYFALRPVPKTVMEFVVQHYPIFHGRIYTAIAETDSGYRVVRHTPETIEYVDYAVDFSQGSVTKQNTVTLYGRSNPKPVAISPTLDIFYTDSSYTTYVISANGDRQVISINAPVYTEFSGDGSRFAIYDTVKNVVVYDLETRSILHEIQLDGVPDHSRHGIKLNFTGSKIKLRSYNEDVIYDLSGLTAYPVANLQHLADYSTFLPSGELVSVLGTDVTIVGGQISRKILEIPCNDNMTKASPDGQWLFGNSGWFFCIIHVPTLLEAEDSLTVTPQTLEFSEDLSSFAFSRDSKYVAVYTLDNQFNPILRILDLATMTIIASTQEETP